MEATVKEQELDQLLRFEQIKELSSDEENPREEVVSRSQYRKPIKNSYSDEESSHSSTDSRKRGETLLPPKPPKGKSALQQAQEEIRWTKQDTSEEDLLSRLQGTGMKDKKIRQLANKCKTINLALERERTIRRNLEQQLNAAMKANEEAKKEAKKEDGRQSMQKTNASKVELKCNNCQQQEKKVMDFRQKLQAAKSQLNKANRLIAREIGEGVDIDQALNEENGWKGRQQKIEKLKGRVKELEERLAAGGANVSHMSGFTQMSAQQQLSSTQRTSTLADNKRKELQNLKVQVEALRSENDLLQGKVKSLTSRKLTLESQLKEAKGQFEKKKQIFVEKSENDDRFIALLKQQNEKLKKDERVVTKVVYKEGKETNEETESLKKEVDLLRKKVNGLQKVNQELQKAKQEPIQQQPKQEKVVKAVNEVREISADRRKQLEEEYLKGNKYLKKLSTEDQEQIYRAWKETKGKF